MRWTLLLLVLVACGGSSPPPMALGEIAPAFALQDLEGQSVTREALAGEPTILNFWATWCGPCKKEIPDLKAIHASGQARVVGIALDREGADKVGPFVKRNDIAYPILLDPEGEVFRAYNGFVVPHTVILDREGQVAAVHVGLASREKLERDLNGL